VLVDWLVREQIPHCFPTNTTSRPRRAVAAKLAGLGIRAPEDRILTPAVAAAAWLRQAGITRPALSVPEATAAGRTAVVLGKPDPAFYRTAVAEARTATPASPAMTTAATERVSAPVLPAPAAATRGTSAAQSAATVTEAQNRRSRRPAAWRTAACGRRSREGEGWCCEAWCTGASFPERWPLRLIAQLRAITGAGRRAPAPAARSRSRCAGRAACR
jgi:hypothetical protein